MASSDPLSDDDSLRCGSVRANEIVTGHSFTVRALAAGLLIGILINLSNTYYGLQAGSSSQMSMVSTLLGYGGFRIFQKCLRTPFSAAENVFVTSVATATGCMPVTAGFTGTIPALEYVIGPTENGPMRIKSVQLVLWSIGLCFFGLIFASLLRESMVVREKLPWPGPTATSYLIKTLHRKSCKGLEARHGTRATPLPQTPADEDNGFTSGVHTEAESDWQARLHTLLRGATTAGIITVLTYFIPITRALPVFGRKAARRRHWTYLRAVRESQEPLSPSWQKANVRLPSGNADSSVRHDSLVAHV